MAQYEESQIEFAILSLIKDPLLNLLTDLAENFKAIIALSARLDTIKADWESFTTMSEDNVGQLTDFLTVADPALGLTQEMIDSAQLPCDVAKLMPSRSSTAIWESRAKLITAQRGLRIAVQEEIQLKQSEEQRANARRRDFGANMQKFAEKVMAKAMS